LRHGALGEHSDDDDEQWREWQRGVWRASASRPTHARARARLQKRYGFIHFASMGEASNAIHALNRYVLNGYTLECEFKKGKPGGVSVEWAVEAFGRSHAHVARTHALSPSGRRRQRRRRQCSLRRRQCGLRRSPLRAW